jgi:hypothetical protein
MTGMSDHIGWHEIAARLALAAIAGTDRLQSRRTRQGCAVEPSEWISRGNIALPLAVVVDDDRQQSQSHEA